MPEIKKAVLGSVRLDSDIWEAIKKMPLSLNQYLRKSLSAGGVFEPDATKRKAYPTDEFVSRPIRPLLKPSQKRSGGGR